MNETNKAGCPRHKSGFDRACHDVRCQQHWAPEGAPTPEQQLQSWVDGKPICPNTSHECCPDFSCCKPALMWPKEKRERFLRAEQGEREKMMMGSLGALLVGEGVNAHVTRGISDDNL